MAARHLLGVADAGHPQRGRDRAALAAAMARGQGGVRRAAPWLQFARVMLSVAESIMFFIAVTYRPLADTVTFYLAAPIYVTALSAVFLKEHVGWRRWSAVVVGFIGVMIALRPSAATLTMPAL